MAKIYALTLAKDERGRFRSVKFQPDPAVIGVNALIEGLRAGQAAVERARYEAKQAVKAAEAEWRRETRTKLLAFVLFDLMAGALLFAGYAGIVG